MFRKASSKRQIGQSGPRPGSTIDPELYTREAIVREVPRAFGRSLLRSGQGQRIDLVKARGQHAGYLRVLRAVGVSVNIIPGEEMWPDGPLVEDMAVVLGLRHALLGRSTSVPRHGEQDALRPYLQTSRDVHELPVGITLDGGDVLVAGDRVFVSLSSRTTEAGADLLEKVARLEHLETVRVRVRGDLQLRWVCSYLGRGILLHMAGTLPREAFAGLEMLAAPESYGAGALAVNDHVLVPEEAPLTAATLTRRGFAVLPVPLSEFLPLRCGPSRLSVRWA